MRKYSGLDDDRTIDLAHEKPFRLGVVSVRPSRRELVRPGRPPEILEPRVMQVLVALARAGGEIVTRDDLTRLCWDGRVVGEDAINRVISRLRKTSAGVGQGAFQLETITKVGYRLTVEGAETPEAPPATAPGAFGRPRVSRRVVLAGAGAAAVLAAGGGWLAWRARPRLDHATQALYDDGWTALENGSLEQTTQAIGMFRRVVQAAPTYADGWGSLAYAYAANDVPEPAALHADIVARLHAAARRALQLDPNNALAEAALVQQVPIFGNWLQAERAYGAALARHPKVAPLLQWQGIVLMAVGRMTEAAALSDREMALRPLLPILAFRRIILTWAANRLEDAEHAVNQAVELFPRSKPIWFTYATYLTFTGRAAQAIALIENLPGRPPGVPDHDFEVQLSVARAESTRAPADVDRAVALNLALSPQGGGYALNAIQFLAGLNRLDEAFAVADAYFFGRGFKVGARSFSKEQGEYYMQLRTYTLFMPCVAAMRADPRFDDLVERMGLKAYWAQSGHLPDYLASRGRRA